MPVLSQMPNAASLAPTGSTGNITGNAARNMARGSAVACQFIVEAVGGTPTVTFKFQGSLDGSNWYDVAYITDASSTLSVATRVVTGVGASVNFIESASTRQYNFIRVITTANTNVTFRAELWAQDVD